MRFFLLFMFNLVISAAGISVDAVAQLKDRLIRERGCVDSMFISQNGVENPGEAMLILENNKVISLTNFMVSIGNKQLVNDDEYAGMLPYQVLTDLDDDGRKELIVFNFTGGSHCCDEVYIFKNISVNNYQFAAKTHAGNVCLTFNKDFIYGLNEHFGYFYTCFACGLEDSARSGLQQAGDFLLRYKNGSLITVKSTRKQNKRIKANLKILAQHPYVKLEDETDQDDGLRKEFAFNFGEYYFLSGKDIKKTKALFDTYYQFPDANNVWKEFVLLLEEISRTNTF